MVKVQIDGRVTREEYWPTRADSRESIRQWSDMLGLDMKVDKKPLDDHDEEAIEDAAFLSYLSKIEKTGGFGYEIYD